MQNFVFMNHMIHTISGGILTFGFKTLAGGYLEHYATNYLGERRGNWAQIFVYVVAFMYLTDRFDSLQRIDPNSLINPHSFNGEVMLGLTMQMFPAKVNQQQYRQLMQEKHQQAMFRMHDMNPYA